MGRGDSLFWFSLTACLRTTSATWLTWLQTCLCSPPSTSNTTTCSASSRSLTISSSIEGYDCQSVLCFWVSKNVMIVGYKSTIIILSNHPSYFSGYKSPKFTLLYNCYMSQQLCKKVGSLYILQWQYSYTIVIASISRKDTQQKNAYNNFFTYFFAFQAKIRTLMEIFLPQLIFFPHCTQKSVH